MVDALRSMVESSNIRWRASSERIFRQIMQTLEKRGISYLSTPDKGVNFDVDEPSEVDIEVLDEVLGLEWGSTWDSSDHPIAENCHSCREHLLNLQIEFIEDTRPDGVWYRLNRDDCPRGWHFM